MLIIHKEKRKVANGFSIIEIMIALVIISLASLVIIPALPTFYLRLQLDESARVLVGDLRYTQQLTITQQTYYCLQFLSPQKEYQILECDSGTVILTRSFPDEVVSVNTIGFSNDRVMFNPYGAVSESGQIIMQGSSTESRTINVKPSGFIQIQ